MKDSYSIFCLILIFLITSSTALIGYDCSSNNGKFTEVSLVDTLPCKMTPRNITKNEKIIQIIQPKVFDHITYYQCLIEIQHFLMRCGHSIDTLVQSALQIEYLELSKDECKELIRTGTFRYNGFTIKVNKDLGMNIVSMETIGSIQSGSCTPGAPITINGIFHDRPVRTSVFQIKMKKGLGSVDLEESQIITEEGLKCNYHTTECFSADEGNIFWDIKFNQPICGNQEFLVIYEGPATHIIDFSNNKKVESYILHYDQYDFQVILTGKSSRTCGQVTLQTEHPKLSVVNQEYDLPFPLKFDPKSMGKNTNLFTYINSKLVYTVTHIKDQIENLYLKIMYDKCQADNKIIHNMMTLAIISPHQFAYQYFGSEGYTASIRGESVYIVKCNPVGVNYTNDGTLNCYQEIPVDYQGRTYYMSPRTRLLHQVGTVVECSSVMPVKYKIQDSWFSITPGGIIITQSPETIRIEKAEEWEFKDIINYASSGIYTPDDIDKVEKIMLNSLNHEAITVQMTRAISGHGSLSSSLSVTNMLTIEEIENLGRSKIQVCWDTLIKKLGWFGNLVSSLIGIIFILKAIQFIINPIINFKMIYSTLGFTWKLLFIWWENIVHHILRKTPTGDRDKKNDNQSVSLRFIEDVDIMHS